MDVKSRNALFLNGKIDEPGLFPQLEEIKKHTVQFKAEFGLDRLPGEPGLILIRGARQMGKSTWLEQKLKETLQLEGAGSAIYLNGDEILNSQMLYDEIMSYLSLISSFPRIPKLFIDEITAIPQWENALKRLYDSGETRQVLIITTGSKAIDLRRGAERLPGRKGRLDRTNYLFTPVSFKQFKEKCASFFKEDLLFAYILTGGSPIAINELIRTERIPEYVIALTKDWILGECAAQERSRNLLTWIAQALLVRGGTPVSLVKVAKESGSANNTVVRGYIDLLQDLLCLSAVLAVDPSTNRPIARKPQKFHWIHLLAAISFHPSKPRTLADIKAFSFEEQGKWLEWLIAQELWRRASIGGSESPELQFYWNSDSHELDFLFDDVWIEVKRGNIHPIEFSWFPKVFPKNKLKVISSSQFHNSFSDGVTFEEFLLDSEF